MEWQLIAIAAVFVVSTVGFFALGQSPQPANDVVENAPPLNVAAASTVQQPDGEIVARFQRALDGQRGK